MPSLDRLVFFGTPEISVPTLAALCEAGRAPVLVVAQPPRKAGRGQQLRQPPVARWALERGLPVEQPRRVRDEQFLGLIRQLSPDLGVVVAFGQIFPGALLEIPAAGCVNVHFSLLPRHRGAAPVQAAIAAGDAVTGVTTMKMDEGLDTGPMLLREEVAIGERETGGELAARLAPLGGALALRTVEQLEAGSLSELEQNDAEATYAPRLERADGRVDWTSTAVQIERRIRAFSPWPGSFTELGDQIVKILEARVAPSAGPAESGVGEFLGLDGGSALVGCGDRTILALERVQREGRQPVSGRDLANGLRLERGQLFG